jgi:nucleoside phosphorylase
MSPGRVLVLCPMKIERVHVQRALRDQLDVTLIQTGIGKLAIVNALSRRLELEEERPGLVILAGACGGLRKVDDVPDIRCVVDELGGEWTPSVASSPSGVKLVAVDRVVDTPESKRALAESTGATIVDMESHAFAAACQHHDLNWCVVRGVSDTPAETLPAEVLGWVTPAGDTRIARAAIDLLAKPRLIPHVTRVLRRSGRVLPTVGERVARIVRDWQAVSRRAQRE